MTIDEIKLTLPAETRLPKYLALADALGNWIALNHPDSGSRLQVNAVWRRVAEQLRSQWQRA